ncbi:hypothetical protein JYK02_04915 [Corallococcus macrosporus]|uniref:Hint domain-containing protein n=1 Tax=Corallococcus macrosporus TaxID=35 RepID=A0ABS3D5A0_9BACT|nr:hypothetical protein [Corallococcus macrosporus]MBN8226848.1 hypothetical protein [Corallococcus macrosporus]
MRSPHLAQALKVLALGLLPCSALAQDPQQARCGSDFLTIDQAIARSEWARRCGLWRNTGGAAAWFSSTAAFDTGYAWAKEYREADTSHAYTGNTHYNNVNYYHARSLYDATPMYSVFQETSGGTTGYWKWSHTTPRARPLYPTFESTNVAGSGTPLYPHPTNTNDCRLFSDTAGTTPWVTTTRTTVCDDEPIEYLQGAEDEPAGPEGIIRDGCRIVIKTVERPFYAVAYCESGCHPGDQLLMLGHDGTAPQDAAHAGREELTVLGPEATLENPVLRVSPVPSDTTDLGDSEHRFHEFFTESGGLLRVTREQPVLTSDGRLVKAESLRPGDALLRMDGTPDRIVTVKQTTQSARIYAVQPDARDPVSRLLLSQGYVVGLSRPQNEDVEQLNRVLRQRGIPAEVLPE